MNTILTSGVLVVGQLIMLGTLFTLIIVVNVLVRRYDPEARRR